jgi:hypothetical protein
MPVTDHLEVFMPHPTASTPRRPRPDCYPSILDAGYGGPALLSEYIVTELYQAVDDHLNVSTFAILACLDVPRDHPDAQDGAYDTVVEVAYNADGHRAILGRRTHLVDNHGAWVVWAS